MGRRSMGPGKEWKYFERAFKNSLQWLIEQDKDDNKFVNCAIAANAKYIVSEDAHFKQLKNIPFPIVNVIRLGEFMEQLILQS